MQQGSTAYIVMGVLLTTWVQILVSMSMGTLSVLAPPLMDSFSLPAHLVGLVISAMYFIAAITSAMSGSYITRFGAIRTSQFCMVATCAGLCIVAAAPNFSVALVGAAVLGFAFGPSTPASTHLLAAAASPRHYNLIFSVKQTGVPLGNALAGLVMPTLSILFGVSWAIVSQAIAALLTVALLEFYRKAYDTGLSDDVAPFGLGQLTGPIMTVLRERRLRVLMISCFSFSLIQIASTSFTVAYLHEELGFSLVFAGLMLTIMQVAGAFGRVAWGILADVTRRASLVLGILASAMTVCTLALAAMGPSWPVLLIGLVAALQGGTAISWNGVYIAEAARLAPEGKIGDVSGGTAFFVFMSVMFAPIFYSGLIGLTHSYGMAFALLGLCTLGSAVALLLGEFKREQRQA